MRACITIAICVLTGVLPLAAQNAKTDAIDATLHRWEKAMSGLQSYVAAIDRTTHDRALDLKEYHQGFAMLSKVDKKAGIQAVLHCVNTANPKSFEKYIYSGTDLYEYAPASNTIRHHKLAVNAKGAVEQDTLVSLVLGMTVKHVKERFDLKPETRLPADGYDYVYVEPRDGKDRAEFSVARLAFDKTNHLIAQIWFRQANGKEITWNFSKVKTNVPISADQFEPKLPDESWKREEIRMPIALPTLTR